MKCSKLAKKPTSSKHNKAKRNQFHMREYTIVLQFNFFNYEKYELSNTTTITNGGASSRYQDLLT